MKQLDREIIKSKYRLIIKYENGKIDERNFESTLKQVSKATSINAVKNIEFMAYCSSAIGTISTKDYGSLTMAQIKYLNSLKEKGEYYLLDKKRKQFKLLNQMKKGSI